MAFMESAQGAEEKLRIVEAAFIEMEIELGKLLGLTRTETRLEEIIKRTRSSLGAMSQ